MFIFHYKFNQFVLLFGIILIISCSSTTSDNKKIFHYNQTVGIESLDPAFAKNQAIMWAVNQLFNTLIEVDSNLKIKPGLATSWDYENNNMDIVFHLRQNVFFHDDICFKGKLRKFKASDVQYSFYRIIDTTVASNGAWIFNGIVKKDKPFEAINDSTFVIHLQKKFQPILFILTMKYCSIVPHEAVVYYKDDFRKHPVGTGPFKIEYWEEGIGLTMIKNLKYFEKDDAGQNLPYIDGISISFVDDKATEFLIFQQGKSDFMNSIDPSFKDVALYKNGELKNSFSKKSTLYKKPYLNTEYFGFNLSKDQKNLNPVVFEKSFRQAVNYAVNRKNIIKFLRNGTGVPAENGIIPKGISGYDSTNLGYTYSPEKARMLLQDLAKKGYKSFNLKLKCPEIYISYGNFIADELLKVGIRVKLDIVHQSLLREEMIRGEAGFFRASWIADYPDAESFLALFNSKNPAPPNYTRFKNAAYDELYQQAIEEVDDLQREKLYMKLNHLICEEAPVLFLYYDEVLNFVSNRVENWHPNAMNMLELRYIKIKD